MKKLLLATLMILTMTSVFGAEVGENDTTCADMVQANRNANDAAVVANEETPERSETTATER